MCGIYCAIGKQCLLPTTSHLTLLEHRGPDAAETTIYELGEKRVVLHTSVLSLRGPAPNKSDRANKPTSSSFCWNGEAWAIRGQALDGHDTSVVHALLDTALLGMTEGVSSRVELLTCKARAVSACLSQVAGPHAFVLLDQADRIVFFGRDFLGRRSLVTTTTETGHLIISSVPDNNFGGPWLEIEADGVYYLDLDAISQPCIFQKVPFSYMESTTDSIIPRLHLNQHAPDPKTLLDQDSESVIRLEGLLRRAISLRISLLPSRATGASEMTPARLAVLFSGGLDCTVLARISHDILPSSEPIDLLNVAFENPRAHKSLLSDSNSASRDAVYEACPDRITGRASHSEIMKACPGREWRFVAINIAYSETVLHRPNIIALMHPHNTEMDLSICLALYFAARGSGRVGSPKAAEAESYTTAARVLLSGLGADELFAGYTRHAVAFKRRGFLGLFEELELDIGRLGKRNLGRDDRVISHWGREARFPYLDETLLHWALSVSIDQKCGFGSIKDDETSVEPGKRVLRCVAERLGLPGVSKEKKRAIQFGTRTAKMETGNIKGTQLLS